MERVNKKLKLHLTSEECKTIRRRFNYNEQIDKAFMDASIELPDGVDAKATFKWMVIGLAENQRTY